MLEIKTQRDFLAQMNQYDEELAALNTPIREQQGGVMDDVKHIDVLVNENECLRIKSATEWNRLTTEIREVAAIHVLRANMAQAEWYGRKEACIELAKVAEEKQQALKPLREQRFVVESQLQQIRINMLELKQSKAQLLMQWHELEKKRKENAHIIHNKKHELIERYPKGSLPEE